MAENTKKVSSTETNNGQGFEFSDNTRFFPTHVFETPRVSKLERLLGPEKYAQCKSFL